MQRLISITLLLTLLLTGCSGKQGAQALSPEDRSDLYEDAIEAARDEMTNEAMPMVTEADDDMAQVTFDLLGVSASDMTAYALSVSPTATRAYAVAAIYPAAGKEDAVLEDLNTFVDGRKQSMQGSPDQHEIAVNTRLETLEDGTILLVMSENQDPVFDAIRDVIERSK